jgi:hypothetical protein
VIVQNSACRSICIGSYSFAIVDVEICMNPPRQVFELVVSDSVMCRSHTRK